MNRTIAERTHYRPAAATDAAPLLSLPVSQAMKAPLISCKPDTTLHEASLLMRDRRIGSLAIVDDAGKPIGLLTCAELYEAVLERNLSGEDKVISAGFQRPYEIGANASLRKAEHLQERKNAKYLIVTEKARPIGILSQTDILRAAASVSSPLLAEIQHAGDFIALRRFYRRLPRFIADIRDWNRSAMATIRVLNEAHRAILQRCITLTLAEIADRGQGTPPAAFALVILGSGGRGEMLLTPDQDNAIILADEVNQDTAAGDWFADFTNNLNRHMGEVGYGLCPGGIMAGNRAWRKGLSQWRRQLRHIIAHPNPKAARWSNIALDLGFLYGEQALVLTLRREIARRLRESPRLLRMMVEDDAEGRPPLGMFDRLITRTADGKKNHIDIKRNALRIVADAARVYAWRAGIDVNNTVDRFRGLARQGALNHEFVKTTLAAYDALLDLYLDQKLQQALAGANADDKPPDDKLLDHNLLGPHEQELLRICLRTVKHLQKRLQEDFEMD
uniref:DNA polymerase-3 subunit epsilon/CBS domain-containing protein n=1 Tax=Candidatus Kentrum sp. FM TaxID=2126340 RepID=A0A450WC08_9GAMM|nr:MAG: DNA polymerase-3 subunit epsilon/CBS domain-containing protein [Candidatus Kentron sp. FM]VFJ63153.1 MAG: DNA polymerase-3 subunit epsilon/CBS domain-containing protein [Candidatus Kentron sp. FM]VFK14583.1 MAG: DNA polymerase-3 subunit epsilon/CBS domain-containing protein [Candidatus Kentron sp. FM]